MMTLHVSDILYIHPQEFKRCSMVGRWLVCKRRAWVVSTMYVDVCHGVVIVITIYCFVLFWVKGCRWVVRCPRLQMRNRCVGVVSRVGYRWG
jgi:hypothetical protein